MEELSGSGDQAAELFSSHSELDHNIGFAEKTDTTTMGLGTAFSTECSSVADPDGRDGDWWTLPPGYVGLGMEDIGWGGYPTDSTAGTGSSYASPCSSLSMLFSSI